MLHFPYQMLKNVPKAKAHTHLPQQSADSAVDCVIAFTYTLDITPIGANVMKKFYCSHRASVTRLGDLLDFGQLFKAFVQPFILPKSPTFFSNLCKGVKIFNLSSEIIFGQLYRHFVTFYWSHCIEPMS